MKRNYLVSLLILSIYFFDHVSSQEESENNGAAIIFGKVSENNSRIEADFYSSSSVLSFKLHSISCGLDRAVGSSEQGNIVIFNNTQNVKSLEPELNVDQSQKRPFFIDASIGKEHIIALDRNHKVWGWGNNNRGQLGIGPKWNFTTNKPFLIESLMNETIIQICSGLYHSLVMTENREIYMFGLIDENFADIPFPHKVLIPTPTPTPNECNNTISNSTTTTTTTTTSKLINMNKQNNNNNNSNSNNNDNLPCHITCGPRHSSIVMSDGRMFVLGKESSSNSLIEGKKLNQRMIVNATMFRRCPRVRLAINNNVCSAFGSEKFDSLIMSNDSVWIINNLNNSLFTEKIQLRGQNIIMTSLGENHGLALTANGTIFSWGNNDFYQLGDKRVSKFNDSIWDSEPQKVNSLQFHIIQSISAYGNYSVLLKRSRRNGFCPCMSKYEITPKVRVVSPVIPENITDLIAEKNRKIRIRKELEKNRDIIRQPHPIPESAIPKNCTKSCNQTIPCLQSQRPIIKRKLWRKNPLPNEVIESSRKSRKYQINSLMKFREVGHTDSSDIIPAQQLIDPQFSMMGVDSEDEFFDDNDIDNNENNNNYRTSVRKGDVIHPEITNAMPEYPSEPQNYFHQMFPHLDDINLQQNNNIKKLILDDNSNSQKKYVTLNSNNKNIDDEGISELSESAKLIHTIAVIPS